jgi:hypothetical protein
MFRRFLKIIRNVVIALLLLGLIGYFAIQQPGFQTWLTQRVASYLSKELGTKVTLGRIEVDLWARLLIKDLYIEDQHQDTLAFIPELRLRTYQLDKQSGVLSIGAAEMDTPTFKIQKYASDSTFNYGFIVDYIDELSGPADTSSSTIIKISELKISNARFIYDNEHRPPRGVFGLDWNHMLVNQMNLDIRDFVSDEKGISASIKDISGSDVSGLEVKKFVSDLRIGEGKVEMKGSDIAFNSSNLKGDLIFKLNDIEDMDYFETRVKMDHVFDNTVLQIGDLAYFVSDLEGMDKEIILSGNVKGTVDQLKGKNLRIDFGDQSFFKGNFSMDGLPNIEQTYINLDVKEITSNKRDLERIQIPPFNKKTYLATPSNFDMLGQMRFSGNFTGFINDFVAFGSLNTAIGGVSGDISFREDESINDYVYKGSVQTKQFDLGKFYSDKNLGPLTCDVAVDGSGLSVDKLDLSFVGEVNSIYANGYNFTNITTDGTFRERYFDGEVFIRDPNAEVDFLGQVDFRNKTAILDFAADIHHVDLKAVNILTQYNYSSISGEIDVRSEGLDFANFEGTIAARDITYCAKSKDYHIDRFNIIAERGAQVRFVLDSDIAVAVLTGNFDIEELAPSFEDILSEIIPNFKPPIRKHREQKFDLNLRILNFDQVSEVFIPELKIAPATLVDINVDETKSFFEVSITSPKVSYQNNEIKGMTIDARRPDQSLYFNINSDGLLIGEDLKFDDFAIDGRTEKDTIYTAMAWGNSSSRHSGDLNGKFQVRGFENYDFIFDRSAVIIDNKKWAVDKGAKISMDSTRIEFTSLAIANNSQRLDVNGIISENPNEELNVNLSAVDISNINSFTGGEPAFYGYLSGNAAFRNLYQTSIFTSDLTLIDFKLNDYNVGDICVESLYDNALRRLRIDGDIEKDKMKPLAFAGYYKLNDEESPLDMVATIQDFDLAFINEFLGEGIMDIQGLTSGTIAITGKPETPQLNGTAYLQNASIFVDYLNTKFKIEEQIGIYPDMFTFDHIRVRDQENNPGYLTGQILHNAFSDWNFDIIVDMEERMLVMNTNQELNSLYYGKAFAKGYVSIYGYDDQLEFDINLKTEAGTKFVMPMSSSEESGIGNFIRFVSSQEPAQEEPLDLSGIKLKFDLDITPEADFKIIFDEAVGDIMSGNGKGHINMEINNLSTFTMYGSVELTKGNYLFTLKNLLNKEFTVRPGGTISWYGDPFAGDLNLKAIYKVSASLSDIIPDVVNSSGQRVPVDLVMNLSGKMFNPGVAFDIELPTMDEVTKSRVQAVISTDQEKNRQAFSLLVLRSFISPLAVNTGGGYARAFSENGTELLSSQLSNWLSQISDDFNLGFNYRPGDEISNQEIALALSTQLFNERLLFSSNVGVSLGNTSNQNPSNLIGDVRLEYKITDEGKIRLVVYNESNDFRMITTQQSLYTQGVGVLYQEEFDTLDEFFCGFKNLFRRKDTQIICYE